MDINKKYQTGVLWQDIQHKEFIDLVNKFSNMQEDNSQASMYTYTLGFLVMYAHHHFNLEEGYMKKYLYPDFEHHQKEHKKLIQQLKDFRKKYPAYTPEAVEILKNDTEVAPQKRYGALR